MHGHIQAYMDAERQRLRAERAEAQSRRWRAVAYALLVIYVISVQFLSFHAAPAVWPIPRSCK